MLKQGIQLWYPKFRKDVKTKKRKEKKKFAEINHKNYSGTKTPLLYVDASRAWYIYFTKKRDEKQLETHLWVPLGGKL